jgi:hypothetical protein
MKNLLYIDMDTERDDTIRIGKPEKESPESPEDALKMLQMDIGTLCEALVVVMKVGGQSGLFDPQVALQKTIEHLVQGMEDVELRVENPGFDIENPEGPKPIS